MSITADSLKAVLDYDRDTGLFRWKVRAARNVFPGAVAGVSGQRGYVHITIEGKQYRAHRLAWLYAHGRIPECIDHINGNPSDNRLSNLREATASQNAMNCPRGRNNSTGIKGVYLNRAIGRYGVSLMVGGKSQFLGYFASVEDAARTLRSARATACGEFANHGEFAEEAPQ
jgi:hypothetical protein